MVCEFGVPFLRVPGVFVLLSFLAAIGPGCGGTSGTRDVPPVASDPGPAADTVVADLAAPVDSVPVGDSGDMDGCAVLYGLPNDKTGLGPDRCRPSCACGDKQFATPAWTAAQIDAIAARVLVDPPAPPAEDPYLSPEQHVPVAGKVCAVLTEPSVTGGYRVATYDGVAAAEAAGAVVTHDSACGLCSSLQDLAVYMRNPDLTAPVRQCGLLGMAQGDDALRQCLRDLGFSEPCLRIWAWNTKHTQAECRAICLALLDSPYHEPDGTLNACLLCDEEKSGPVFKAVAGRTRRNTGVPSSMCRPCSEVLPLEHVYPM